jgi:transposase
VTGTKGVYSVERKEALVQRILNGGKVNALHQETRIPQRNLYAWVAAYRKEGVRGLRGPGKPPQGAVATSGGRSEGASLRIAELERKIGQQALEIDFLQRAFKRVKESRPSNDGTGATASTGRSAR